ncbi:unnamed protein product [Sphagnum balticum]
MKSPLKQESAAAQGYGVDPKKALTPVQKQKDKRKTKVIRLSGGAVNNMIKEERKPESEDDENLPSSSAAVKRFIEDKEQDQVEEEGTFEPVKPHKKPKPKIILDANDYRQWTEITPEQKRKAEQTFFQSFRNPEVNEWSMRCHLRTLNISEEEAKNAILTAQNAMCCKGLHKSNLRFAMENKRESIPIWTIPRTTYITDNGTKIKWFPNFREIGIPIHQVLRTFANKEKLFMNGVCKNVKIQILQNFAKWATQKTGKQIEESVFQGVECKVIPKYDRDNPMADGKWMVVVFFGNLYEVVANNMPNAKPKPRVTAEAGGRANFQGGQSRYYPASKVYRKVV